MGDLQTFFLNVYSFLYFMNFVAYTHTMYPKNLFVKYWFTVAIMNSSYLHAFITKTMHYRSPGN